MAMKPKAAAPVPSLLPTGGCKGCPVWWDLRPLIKAQGAGIPRRAGTVPNPGLCRLRPVPVESVIYGAELFPLISGDDPGCLEGGRLAGAAAGNSPPQAAAGAGLVEAARAAGAE